MSTIEQRAGADVYAARVVRAMNDGFTTLMTSMFPRTLFRGYDSSAGAIAGTTGRRNLVFDVVNLATLDDEPEEYDLITCFDLGDDPAALANVARSLKKDGLFVIRHRAAEEGHPFAPLLLALNAMQRVPVAIARGEMEQATVAESLVRAGFTSLRFERFPSDPLHSWCVAGLA